jgi:hypothetical protein
MGRWTSRGRRGTSFSVILRIVWRSGKHGKVSAESRGRRQHAGRTLMSTRRAEAMATRCRRHRLGATTRPSSGCSRRGPTSTRKAEAMATRCRGIGSGPLPDRPAAAQEMGRTISLTPASHPGFSTIQAKPRSSQAKIKPSLLKRLAWLD